MLEARLGHVWTAAKLFKRAAQLFPSHAPVYAAWAEFQWSQGNYKAAKRTFLLGEEKAPPHAPLLSAHARCAVCRVKPAQRAKQAEGAGGSRIADHESLRRAAAAAAFALVRKLSSATSPWPRTLHGLRRSWQVSL